MLSPHQVRQELKEARQLLHACVEDWIKRAADQYTAFTFDSELWRIATEFTTGGKCFRGGLLYGVVTRLTDDQDQHRQAIELGAIVELYESGILMQDDVMDGDELRRGKPSAHRQIAALAAERKLKDAEQFGYSTAICLGDALFFLAQQKVNELNVPPAQHSKLAHCVAEEMLLLGLAQVEDLRLAAAAQVSREEIIAMFVGKTGRYSTRWPLELALLLTNQTDTARMQAVAVAEQIGILYQIRDDYLGLFGDSSKTGKNTVSDIQQGKRTLFWWQAMQTLTGSEREQFLAVYGTTTCTQEEMEQLKQLLQESGVVAEVDEYVAQVRRDAQHKIEQLPLPTAVQEYLQVITELITTRQA